MPPVCMGTTAPGDGASSLGLSQLPFRPTGDSVPPFSVCPSAETSSPNLTARVNLKA